MRRKGKITNWIDDKGFGFITPSDGGEQIFVHITSFDRTQGRPAAKASVTYELKSDSRGRVRAENVKFSGRSLRRYAAAGWRLSTIAIPLAFLACVVALSLTAELTHEIMWLYLLASPITFLLYAKDKSAAKTNRRRTPENRLHLFALIGGWPGAWVAQQLLRHKSRKRSFRVFFWVTVIINCGALVWISTPEGAQIVKSTLDFASALLPQHTHIEWAK